MSEIMDQQQQQQQKQNKSKKKNPKTKKKTRPLGSILEIRLLKIKKQTFLSKFPLIPFIYPMPP